MLVVPPVSIREVTLAPVRSASSWKWTVWILQLHRLVSSAAEGCRGTDTVRCRKSNARLTTVYIPAKHSWECGFILCICLFSVPFLCRAVASHDRAQGCFFCTTAEKWLLNTQENELSQTCWQCWGVQTYFTLIKCQRTVLADQFGGVYTVCKLAKSKVNGRLFEAEYLRSQPAPVGRNLISCIILLQSQHRRGTECKCNSLIKDTIIYWMWNATFPLEPVTVCKLMHVRRWWRTWRGLVASFGIHCVFSHDGSIVLANP